MIKSSFAVGYRMNRRTNVVLGVTSIVPNLNGVLMFTEDGENHFIESYQMGEALCNMFISYEDDLADMNDIGYHIIDHRRK